MGAKILAVDDEEGILRLLKRALERDGADDYIRKPFGIGELRARVQAHIRRERREKKHAVTVGNLRFYLREKQIEYGEQEILLTPGEYEICEYLALHRGQVFSREQIYEHVYGYDKDGDESAVTEYVKNIRAKFRKLGLAPVETVWGIGYRWTAGVEKGNGR